MVDEVRVLTEQATGQPAAQASVRTSAAERNSKQRWRILRIVALSLAAWLLLAWVGARMLIVKSELASADAIVVLSGSSTYVERSDWAAKLFKEGRAPIIILTNDNLQGGWSEAEQRNPFFFERAAQELRERGVPAEKIKVITEEADGTYQESLKLREYATTHNLRTLLVVTSAYHSRRALWTLRRVFQGSNVEIGLDGPPPGDQTPSPATWWLHMQGWKLVPGEYVKMIYYWIHY